MNPIFLLLFCGLLETSRSVGDHELAKDKTVKTKGRMSRVTWLLHEKENEDLDRRMFEEDDKPNKKIHYTKRKYNVKLEHKRKEKLVPPTSKKPVNISKRKEIVVPKYVHGSEKLKFLPTAAVLNGIDRNMKKKQLVKQINIGTTDVKRSFKKVPNIEERNKFYNRNTIDKFYKDIKGNVGRNKNPHSKVLAMKGTHVGFEKPTEEFEKYARLVNPPVKKHDAKDKIKFINSKVSSSQIQRRPKKVYMKSMDYEANAVRRVPNIQLLSKPDQVKNFQRKSIRDNVPGENISPVMALGSGSLANPPKAFLGQKVHEDDKTSVADELARRVRVLCWVMTHPTNHNKTCQPIKDTWGRRCNKLLFISTEYDEDIPTVKLNVKEGHEFLWPKVKAAFQHVHDNYRDQYDWFLRADDDTFIVIENLRYLLAGFNPNEPMFFGCRFKHFSPQGYMSGGAGIVMSRAALDKFISAIGQSDICKVNIDFDLENEDVNMGICLSRVGVRAMDSRDVAHKGRFLVFMPQDHLSPTKISHDKAYWYWKYVYYPTESGAGCCSDYAISFHYVTADDMYALEYLIYRVRPYGIEYGSAPIPEILERVASQRRSNYQTTTEETTTTAFTTPSTTLDPFLNDDLKGYELRRNGKNQWFEEIKPTVELKPRRVTEATTVEYVYSEILRNESLESTADETSYINVSYSPRQPADVFTYRTETETPITDKYIDFPLEFTSKNIRTQYTYRPEYENDELILERELDSGHRKSSTSTTVYITKEIKKKRRPKPEHPRL